MIDYINRNSRDHILTIEDPVEFVHQNKGCLINHREIGTHTESFAAALRAALREDPDVILVGEMRDLSAAAAPDRSARPAGGPGNSVLQYRGRQPDPRGQDLSDSLGDADG
ncbi:MAG: Flp pilus assembly complex ATPase component TadA [Deltaproteobacteria bacterium]|nr:Flp pilus assembly complex ATPase component TadA [Deltaproteobacteria bacterium]